MRANSRVLAFKLIFAHLFECDVKQVEQMAVQEDKFSAKEIEYANEIVGAYMENQYHISKEIDEILENYQKERLVKVDLALIYLAMAELQLHKTPKPVVVNEVVEMAKTFSTDQSPKFINGVLAKTKQ